MGNVTEIADNLDVVARADWVIDLGPGAGHEGGRIVFVGRPAELAEFADSLTGRHLRGRAETYSSATTSDGEKPA